MLFGNFADTSNDFKSSVDAQLKALDACTDVDKMIQGAFLSKKPAYAT